MKPSLTSPIHQDKEEGREGVELEDEEERGEDNHGLDLRTMREFLREF